MKETCIIFPTNKDLHCFLINLVYSPKIYIKLTSQQDYNYQFIFINLAILKIYTK